MIKPGLVCAAFLSLIVALPALGDNGIVGSIKSVDGKVTIVRNGEELAAKAGAKIYEQDVLRTGKDAAAGVILRDDTTLSLGPSSELAMTEFTFEPKDGLFSMVLDMIKGTFVYASGRISKLAPGSVKLETPVGAIAVRGTRLLIKVAE